MVVQYRKIHDNEASIINDIGRCAACHLLAWTSDQQIAPLSDEVADGELEEQGAIEAAGGVIIDVLDAGVVAQPCGPGPRLEALLAAQRCLMFEQQAEPFGMFEGVRLGSLFERLEALGHAVQAEVMQHIEGWVGQHGTISFQWK